MRPDDIQISINGDACIRCGKCVRICPSRIFRQEGKGDAVKIELPETCIVCGHCVAVCNDGALKHSSFPAESIHAFSYEDFPSAEQMMLLCKARRSNRAFSKQPVPEEFLRQIVEAAHRAPTASNAQELSFVMVTDPKVLKAVTEFTLTTFQKVLKKLKNPVLRFFVKMFLPDALRYETVFERLSGAYRQGNDLVLRNASAVLFIYAPKKSRFGCQDANLAYENGSLYAECLGVSQFYTGFVCSAVHQDKKGTLEKILGIDGEIHAGMALGMPAFRYGSYIDREALRLKWL